LDYLPAVLYRWRKEQKNYGKNSFPGRGNPKMTDEQKEIARLKKQLKEAELERDILKKAIGIPACRLAGSPRATRKIQVHKTASYEISCP